MITLDAATVRRLDEVLRRSVPRSQRRSATATIHAENGCLRVWMQGAELLVRFLQSGDFGTGRCALRWNEFLKVLSQGRDGLELDPAEGTARWSDRGVPRSGNIEPVADSAADMDVPSSWHDASSEMLAALAAAHGLCSPERTRFATDRICLRGDRGQIVATDGHQLLLWDGFEFPWSDDLLIAAFPMLDVPELREQSGWRFGRTERHLVLEGGPWTFAAAIEKDGRFPSVDRAVPSPSASDRTLRLSPADAAFLRRTLPRLPGKDADFRPVTLDLNGHVGVLARETAGGSVTELHLCGSSYEGGPVRVVCNRDHLQAALNLGLAELRIANPDRPLVFRDERRRFVLMPLAAAGALHAQDAAFRLRSSDLQASPRPRPAARVLTSAAGRA
ncbi:MAG: hypothetical protein U0744_13590 [Gemmataceae bacterium]